MRYLLELARTTLRLPHKRAEALLARDYLTWVRIEFLGVASALGVLAALRRPRTSTELADQLEITEPALFDAFLAVGAAVGELRHRGDRWELRGVRARAVADPAADGMSGIVEELAHYDADVYDALPRRLRGEPPGDYLDDYAEIVARASRAAEPLLLTLLRELVASHEPGRVLEIGCGSGVNLRHVGEASMTVSGCGVEVAPEVVALAKANLTAWGLDDRFEVRQGDVRTLPDELDGPWDLVLLLQNIYYFPSRDRPALLTRLRALAPRGTVVVASPTAGGDDAVAANLDLVLRSTADTYPLPTAEEITNDLGAAGFTDVVERRLAPLQPLRAFVAR